MITAAGAELFADEFPYRLNFCTDGALSVAGIAGCSSYIWGRNSVRAYSESDLALLDKNSINAVDKTAAGRWSQPSAVASTIAAGALAIVPLSFTADTKVHDRWVTLTVMYAESWLLCFD